MDELKEDVRSVSGIRFQIEDKSDLIFKSEKISYLIYVKNGNDYIAIRKFIGMFAMSYKMVLIVENSREIISFIIFSNENDKEQLDSIMDWVSSSHPEWVVINCQDSSEVPKIIGYRIANNMFHAKKIMLQGEVLD